jgi:multisubunit Na+/H+ antiporter MnhG subunit
MNQKQIYSISVGTLMMIASFGFFLLPLVFSNIDAFIPVMMAIISFMVGVAFFFMGLSEK